MTAHEVVGCRVRRLASYVVGLTPPQSSGSPAATDLKPMVTMRVTPGGIVLVLALLGCGSDDRTGLDMSPVNGGWVGTIADAPDNVLEWTLEDTNGRISGRGSFSNSAATVELSVEGTFSSPNLTLTLTSQAFNDFTFTGTVSEEFMKGRLNGSGFVNREVTLTRR